ncbi:MAG: WYL domain-containing protein [Abitibacteriaceae bacterium]|nr:WYL domain-containing protein [Abditibacteriaceae bacterium]
MTAISLQDDRLRRLTRLFIIANALESGERITYAKLAEDCGCNLKTIQRDCDFLKEAKMEFHYDRKRRSLVLDRPLPSREVKLCASELIALAMTCAAGLGKSGLPGAAQARTAWNKLTAALPLALREELAGIGGVLAEGTGARRDYRSARLAELAGAALHHETVEILYHTLSRDDISYREVDPYCIAPRNGYLQLAAYCHRRHEIRLFALDAILEVRPTGKQFKPPKNFSLEKYMWGSVGTLRGEPTSITLLFDPAIARWAKRRQWEFPYSLEETAAGLLLRGEVSGLEEIRNEILHWGAKVTVLEPPALRAALWQEVEAIAAKYRA